MIKAEKFTQCFLDLEIDYFTGVPDSCIKEWLRLLFDNSYNLTNRIAANEGAAIANAAGYHLSTGKIGVVYLQNSGLGNCINPLTSLTDSQVYSIPLIMIIGWRGEPGSFDEPQHKKMGHVTKDILNNLSIEHSVLNYNNYQTKIVEAFNAANRKQQPYALIVRPDFFAPFTTRETSKTVNGMIREDAIRIIVESINKDSIVVSTTGKTSRELYEVCINHHRGHNNNFYNVGSMGHASAIALEIAIQKSDRKVYILDGDGALIMHMGTLASIGSNSPSNLTHIVFDNKSHESTGGQPTLSGDIDIPVIMDNCNYANVVSIKKKRDLINILQKPISTLLGIVVTTQLGSRSNLGRPSDTPKAIKNRFMKGISDAV